mgnify:CR=1 FL=1
MSTEIEFYKTYTRKSRSPWLDNARVVMTFRAESKNGVYLHLGDCGINGFSISKELQTLLPESIRGQYIKAQHIDIVMHVFSTYMEEYCKTNVSINEFKDIFLLDQESFFSDDSKSQWEKSYNLFLKD